VEKLEALVAHGRHFRGGPAERRGGDHRRAGQSGHQGAEHGRLERAHCPEQVEKVREITERHQPRMVTIRNETFYKLGREQKQLQEEIMPLLTAAQAERWKALNARHDANFKRTFKIGNTNAPAVGR
jgi:hypothetical protein